MAIWPHHIILLIIISNNISSKLSIALIYYLVLDNSLFLIHQTLFIYYWKLAFLYCIIEKRISYYLIYWKVFYLSLYLLKLTSSPLFLILLYDYWAIGYISLFQIKFLVEIRKTWWPNTRLIGYSKYGYCKKMIFQFIAYLYINLVIWLIWSL